MEFGEKVQKDAFFMSHDSLDSTGGISLLSFDTTTVQTRSDNFPLSTDISRDITPGWILALILFFFAALSWIKIGYPRHLSNIFRSSMNLQLAKKLHLEPGIVKKRIFIFLNSLYYLSSGLFLYLIGEYFEFRVAELEGAVFYGAITLFLILSDILKIIAIKITGSVFSIQDLLREALFHRFLFKKIFAILVVPMLFFMAFSMGITHDIAMISGIVMFFGIRLLNLYHETIFIYKSVVLFFYFILYLCCLEILPLLVVIKLVISLSKVT